MDQAQPRDTHADTVEILAHITAPGLGADDKRYRAIATAYLDLNCSNTRLMVCNNNATASDPVAPSFPKSQTPPEPSESTSSCGLIRSRDSSSSASIPLVTPKKARASDNHDSVDVASEQHSWQTPPSVIQDSDPDGNLMIPMFNSPTRLLENFLGSELSTPQSKGPRTHSTQSTPAAFHPSNTPSTAVKRHQGGAQASPPPPPPPPPQTPRSNHDRFPGSNDQQSQTRSKSSLATPDMTTESYRILDSFANSRISKKQPAQLRNRTAARFSFEGRGTPFRSSSPQAVAISKPLHGDFFQTQIGPQLQPGASSQAQLQLDSNPEPSLAPRFSTVSNASIASNFTRLEKQPRPPCPFSRADSAPPVTKRRKLSTAAPAPAPDGAVANTNALAITIQQPHRSLFRAESDLGITRMASQNIQRRALPRSGTLKPGTWANVPTISLMELSAPTPSISVGRVEASDLVTEGLKKLAADLDMARRYRPAHEARALKPFERGHWHVDCSTWPQELKLTSWRFLRNFVMAGCAGWGVRCCRDEAFSWFRVYCWGYVVGHVWMTMYLASKRQVLVTGAVWIGGDGKPLIVMSAKKNHRDSGEARPFA